MRNPNPVIIDLCILIPCYNNFEGLLQSLNSIVYDPGKYIVLIADDGSTDPITIDKIQRYLQGEVNCQILRFEHNLGISRVLNKSLEFIYSNFSARFIARLDCGDTCSPERFYKQVSFLESNPGIHLLGSWCYFKERNSGEAYKYMTPTGHRNIKRSMNFRNVFIHPTVMWRASATQPLKYPEEYPHAEDYGLFYAMISNSRSAIIDEFLVTCEISPKGISNNNRAIQLKSRLKVIIHYSKNKLFLLLGALKLISLMAVPYQIVFHTKKRLYRV